MKTYFRLATTAMVLTILTPLFSQPFAAAQRMRVGRNVDPTPVKGSPADLHIPPTNRVNFNYQMNDGGGFNWDIQYYGTVGCGTNNAYSQGMYLMLNGNQIGSNGYGYLNAGGDELEIGPTQWNNVKISRRIKVYKDQPLARWIEIFENPTGQETRLNVQIMSNLCYQLTETKTSAGGAAFGDKDWGFITLNNGGGNVPALLHLVCDKKAKTRPAVQIQGNQIFYRYTLTVPAGKTVLLVHWQSQNTNSDTLAAQMKQFNSRKLLGDLSSAMRKLILNISQIEAIGGIELERGEAADMVKLKTGDPVFGTVTNESFALQTFCGPLTLPAAQVLGMAAAPGDDEGLRFVLADGQIISGQAPQGKLNVTLSTGGKLQVPLAHISQWSFRISPQRPEKDTFANPYLVLRSGDRLSFDPAAIAMKFRTRHGLVDVISKDLLEIRLENPGNGVHRAVYLNGSTLAGFIEPESIALTLSLGPKATISRDMIHSIRFAPEDKPDATLAHVWLSNGDELLGTIAEPKLSVQTEYGTVEFKPETVRMMAVEKNHQQQAVVQLWDGTILRGKFEPAEMTVQICPGPTLKIYTDQIAKIVQSQALPPAEVNDKVQKLIARLGAESFKDRQEATEALVKMGPVVIPILQKHANSGDPEVRQRIEQIIERLGGKTDGSAPPPAAPGVLQLEAQGLNLNGGCVQVLGG